MSLTNTNKHDGDLWRTPEVVRNGVLSLLKPNETKLLDPCVGRGDLCDLDKYDYKCFDIQELDGQPDGTIIKSFLKTTASDNAENRVVVMNPPFSIGRDFIEHALDIADTVIVICPFSVVKPFRHLITAWYGEYWWKSAFYVTFPLAAFRLERLKGFTWGIREDFDYLFGNHAIRPMGSLPRYDGQDHGLIFVPSLLGTYHDWNWTDKRTGQRGWVMKASLLSEEQKKIFTHYQQNCKGKKKGERRVGVYWLDTDESDYDYFTKCYPKDNWYKVRGIDNNGLETLIPEQWEPCWNEEEVSEDLAKNIGQEILNDRGDN